MKYLPNPKLPFTSLLAGLLLTASVLPAAYAGEAENKLAKPIIEPVPESRIHGLLNLEFSDKYLTPRGVLAENKGVVFQPLLVLFFDLYKGDGWLNDITFTLSGWSTIHSHVQNFAKSSTVPNWFEFDFGSSLNFKFLKTWEFDVNYGMWNYPSGLTSQQHEIDLTLKYDDTPFWGPEANYGIHPYVTYFKELKGKVTPEVNKTSVSYYFALGIDPYYKFKPYPVTLDLNTYVLLPGDKFYGEPGNPGLFSTTFKATVPLLFVPKQFGSWSVYAGVTYMHLFNEGIIAGDEAFGGAAGKHIEDIVQFHGGVSLFF